MLVSVRNYEKPMKSPKIPRFTFEDNPSLSNLSQRWGNISFYKKNPNNSFKIFCTNLALTLVKLSHSPNNFDVESVLGYYE